MALKKAKTEGKAAKPKHIRKAFHATKKVLGKRYDLPVKGKLANDVKAPKWLKAIGGYFAGAWRELKEVRWPTRRATWSLTLAVILFTVVFMLMTVGLDYVFELLIKQVIL